jgi:hypothetical protein
MKIVFVNLNVGSAIEYYGSIIGEWVKEANPDISVIKQQGINYYDAFSLLTPDLIILNELYPNVITHILNYITDNPSTRLIVIAHVWKELFLPEYVPLFNKAEYIVILNKKPAAVTTLYDSKILNRFYPTADIFSYVIPWNKRNLFCYFGHVLPHKFSVEFIQKIKQTDLFIECFGKMWNAEEPSWTWSFPISKNDYYDLLFSAQSSGNLKLNSFIKQSEVPKELNNYKFFILPHDGYEPFNATIMQAIFTGTIPLIVNDRNSGTFDGNWVNWCDGLHYETNDVDTMIANLLEIKNADLSSFEKEAHIIALAGKERFNYEQFKQEFIALL